MKSISCMVIAIFLMAASTPEMKSDTAIKGAWKLARAQYGNGTMEDLGGDESTYKLFTGTRWSATHYDKGTKKINGTCGGSYKITGDQYVETVEYYSWDPAVEGKTFTFTMTIENGMLHQKGTIEYKDNPKYLIDEWYLRVD